MWQLGARGELAPEPGSSRIYLSARPPPIDRGQEVASRPAELKPGAASPAQSVTKWVTALSKAGKYPRWVLTGPPAGGLLVSSNLEQAGLPLGEGEEAG